MVKLGEICAHGNSWGLNLDIGEKKKVKAKPSVREAVLLYVDNDHPEIEVQRSLWMTESRGEPVHLERCHKYCVRCPWKKPARIHFLTADPLECQKI